MVSSVRRILKSLVVDIKNSWIEVLLHGWVEESKSPSTPQPANPRLFFLFWFLITFSQKIMNKIVRSGSRVLSGVIGNSAALVKRIISYKGNYQEGGSWKA